MITILLWGSSFLPDDIGRDAASVPTVQTSVSIEVNEAKKERIAEVHLALCSLCCLLFPSSESC